MNRTGRDNLVSSHTRLVQQVVASLVSSLNLPKSLTEEFLSAGYLGLVEAAARFKPEAGTAFKTYAWIRVRGAVLDSLRRSGSLPRGMYRKIKALEGAGEVREGLFDARQRLSPAESAATVLEYAAQALIASGLVHATDGERPLAKEPNPHEALEASEDRKLLLRLIRRLPQPERSIIREYYLRDLSFSEILQKHPSLSKSWLSKLHARGLRMLREMYCKAQEQL